MRKDHDHCDLHIGLFHFISKQGVDVNFQAVLKKIEFQEITMQKVVSVTGKISSDQNFPGNHD